MKRDCDPARCKAYGPGLENGILGVPNPFTVETRGQFRIDLWGSRGREDPGGEQKANPLRKGEVGVLARGPKSRGLDSA